MPPISRRPTGTTSILAAVALASWGAALPGRADAGEPARASEPPRGAVDAAPFAQLATDEETLVEVDLKPGVLRALGRAAGAKSEPEERLLAQLSSVRAVIVELGPGRLEAASKLIESTAAALRSKGWEEPARIRDRGARVRVLLLPDGQRLAGLTVLILQREDPRKGEGRGEGSTSQLVFANITGQFDLADLGKVSGQLDIPGLQSALGDASAPEDAGSKAARPRGAGEAKAP